MWEESFDGWSVGTRHSLQYATLNDIFSHIRTIHRLSEKNRNKSHKSQDLSLFLIPSQPWCTFLLGMNLWKKPFKCPVLTRRLCIRLRVDPATVNGYLKSVVITSASNMCWSMKRKMR